MTNHPRRVGRRKHQRKIARRWVDLTPFVSDVRVGEHRLAFSRLAVSLECDVQDRPADEYKANELGKAIGYRRAARDLRRALAEPS